MILFNKIRSTAQVPKSIITQFVCLLAPYAPHLAEELWDRLGECGLVAAAQWPEHNESLCVSEQIYLVVQVNGKRRDVLTLEDNLDAETIEAMARGGSAKKYLEGREVVKVSTLWSNRREAG